MNKNKDTFSPNISSLQPSDAEVNSKAQAMATLLEERQATKEKTSFLKGPRRIIAVALAAVVVSAGVATAAGLFSSEDVAVGAGIGCYQQANLDADTTIVGAAANPVAVCAEMWERGMVEPDVHSRPSQLTACSDASEPVRVFPAGPGICGDLGLRALPDGYNARANTTQSVMDVISQANISIEGEPCASPEVLVRQVRENLRTRELNWVEVALQGSGPCTVGVTFISDDDPSQLQVNAISRELAEAHFEGKG